MAQAVNYNFVSEEISKIRRVKIKTTSQAITETQEYDLEQQAEETKGTTLTVMETWERGEAFKLSAASSAKVLASLARTSAPTQSALKAAKEFNRRVRENNGVRTIR